MAPPDLGKEATPRQGLSTAWSQPALQRELPRRLWAGTQLAETHFVVTVPQQHGHYFHSMAAVGGDPGHPEGTPLIGAGAWVLLERRRVWGLEHPRMWVSPGA